MVAFSNVWLWSFVITTAFAKLAVVYTGAAAYCDDGLNGDKNSSCWDAAGWLLGNSTNPPFNVVFKNQSEMEMTGSLEGVDLFVQPGGALSHWIDVWDDVKPFASTIRSFVENGGRYLGLCQGAYLAGTFGSQANQPSIGYNMMPPGVFVDEENSYEKDNIGVYGDFDDLVIGVNYTLNNSTFLSSQHLYFQDGATVIDNTTDQCSPLLQAVGQYLNDSNIAIAIFPYGKGIVGVSGPHIEADWTFWEYPDPPVEGPLINPDNLSDPTNGYLIGKDFLTQLMNASRISVQDASGCSETQTLEQQVCYHS